VKGHVVWTIPPLADSSVVSSIASTSLDQHENHPLHMTGKIAIVQRGKIPIATKVIHVQRAGAIACIVLDNGICHDFDQHCVPGSDMKKGDRFAVSDNPVEWYDSLLVSSLSLPFLPLSILLLSSLMMS
jgi:hypothetical protein